MKVVAVLCLLCLILFAQSATAIFTAPYDTREQPNLENPYSTLQITGESPRKYDDITSKLSFLNWVYPTNENITLLGDGNLVVTAFPFLSQINLGVSQAFYDLASASGSGGDGNASSICSGASTFLSGEGGCVDLNSWYVELKDYTAGGADGNLYSYNWVNDQNVFQKDLNTNHQIKAEKDIILDSDDACIWLGEDQDANMSWNTGISSIEFGESLAVRDPVNSRIRVYSADGKYLEIYKDNSIAQFYKDDAGRLLFGVGSNSDVFFFDRLISTRLDIGTQGGNDLNISADTGQVIVDSDLNMEDNKFFTLDMNIGNARLYWNDTNASFDIEIG